MGFNDYIRVVPVPGSAGPEALLLRLVPTQVVLPHGGRHVKY